MLKVVRGDCPDFVGFAELPPPKKEKDIHGGELTNTTKLRDHFFNHKDHEDHKGAFKRLLPDLCGLRGLCGCEEYQALTP